jgi:hypothetical protein
MLNITDLVTRTAAAEKDRAKIEAELALIKSGEARAIDHRMAHMIGVWASHRRRRLTRMKERGTLAA